MRTLFRTLSILVVLLLVGCEGNHSIVNNVEERDANEIVVFLASKGIEAQKVQATATGAAAATGPSNLFSITVDADHATEAMALLTRYGLPRIQGTKHRSRIPGQGTSLSSWSYCEADFRILFSRSSSAPVRISRRASMEKRKATYTIS